MAGELRSVGDVAAAINEIHIKARRRYAQILHSGALDAKIGNELMQLAHGLGLNHSQLSADAQVVAEWRAARAMAAQFGQRVKEANLAARALEQKGAALQNQIKSLEAELQRLRGDSDHTTNLVNECQRARQTHMRIETQRPDLILSDAPAAQEGGGNVAAE